MKGNAEVDRHRTPGELALCCAMRRGYMRLNNGGREVEEMRTDDSVTIAMTSWPYYVWIGTRCDEALVNDDSHRLCQIFSILIKTVNDNGKMALENVPFTQCLRCSHRYDGRLCIFHAIPPWEFIRCFCLAHPALRGGDCINNHDPGNSECPRNCPHWGLIKGEMRPVLPMDVGHHLVEKGDCYASSDTSSYYCIAEMMLIRLRLD